MPGAMNQKQCPKCKSVIEGMAQTCRHCGANVAMVLNNGCIGLIGICCIIAFIYYKC